jgi:DNA-binding CsgD family transcriptional regulator
MDLNLGGNRYNELLDLTKSNASPNEIDSFLEGFWDSPLFHQLQLFSNQAVRILNASDFSYIYISPTMRELTGYDVEEIKHGGLLFIYRCVPMVDILRLTAATYKVKRAIKKLTPEEKLQCRFSYDLRFSCKDGSEKKILQNCHILKLNSKHEPLILLFASTDITAYKNDTRMNYSLSVFRPAEGFVDVIRETVIDEDCPLSPRELEVLRHTSFGKSENDIAAILNLSVETVKTHRKNMLNKSNARNAVELVRIAIAKSWI